MNHTKTQTIACLLLALILAACTTVPLTGRQQLDLVPSNQIMSMSVEQYD